jgi:colicin import membrane protein
MSYDEWVRRNGQPRVTTTTRPSTARTPRRNIPRIDTDYKNAAQSAMPQGSLRGTSDAEQTALGRYISAVTDLLHDAWDKPVGLAQSTSAVVDFDISPDGKYVNVRITRRSGNAQFDQSVLECFRNADSPGSPPNGHTLSLHLTISMTDE